jgi:TonB-linked SusC/RagA family outer membrane protein
MKQKKQGVRFLLWKTVLVAVLISVPFSFVHAASYEDKSASEIAQDDPAPVNKITGVVTDDNGEPLIGVTVRDKSDTQNATVTDIDGRFTITTATKNPVLVFSYIGYSTQEIVAKTSSLNVSLKEEHNTLNDVVVIGYGTQVRKSVVGAVDRVGSEMIENKPVANVTQALQGASPNLVIQRRNYNPNGEATNINIRGISTTNSNSPLIVIDGLIQNGDALNMLNPNDIDNVSVLKDAGAAAIYGSRSSNGVILVTTKKGKLNQSARVKLSSSIGWEDPDILFHAVPGYQNMQLRNLAATNSGNNPLFTPQQIADEYAARGQEDWWYDQIFRTALQQSHNVSVTGGSKNSTYMVSVGYYDQESNYVGKKEFGIQRYNIRSNLSTEIGRFKLEALMAFTRNNSISTTGSSLEINASRIPNYSYYKMKDQGKYLINDVVSDFNPLGELESGGRNKYRNNDFNGSLSAEMKIIDGLKLRGLLGVDVQGQHRYTRTREVEYYLNVNNPNPSYVSSKGDNAYVDDWNSDSYLINSQLLLDYNKSFGKHNVTGLLGATNESFTATANEIRIQNPNKDLGTDASDDAAINIGKGSSVTPMNTTRTSITSVLGRASYNYADRYYAEFSFRYDGSSKFASKNRWGFFPSFSAGWRISEEEFMGSYRDNVGDLKLRASYGVLGNQTIGTYDRYTTYNMYSNTYAYNNETVTGAGFTLGSENLKWEKTKTFNIGADATFFNGSLNLGLDYYVKRTTDILMKPVVPSVFGTSQSMDNYGEVSNHGWEVAVNYRFDTGSVHHSISANIGDSFNKLKKFPEQEQISGADEIWILRRVGVPLGSYYGYKTDGMFKSYEEIEASATPVGVKVQPGDLKFVDRNGDGIIDSKDRYVLGNAFPRYTFGFTYSVAWKGLDFSIFAQGVGKRDMMLRGELMEPFHVNYSYCIYKHQLDFWTPTNTDAKYPRLSAPGSSSNQNNYRMGSDLYILDGSYLRIKNITLGYTLPKPITAKVGIEKLRIYVTGQNLFTFTHNSFIDPESSEFGNNMTNSGANSGRNYPVLKYYGFGLDLEF